MIVIDSSVLVGIIKGAPHPNAARLFFNWLLSREGQEVFTRGMGVGSRRFDIDTGWLKDYGVIAAKDFLNLDQYHKFENQSEEKIYKIREPGAAMARKAVEELAAERKRSEEAIEA